MSSKLPGTREQKNKFVSMLRFIPDEPYLKLMYRVRMKKKLNLRNPQTFNEKIQWLKLHDRRPEYVTMVDKYEAKKYVANIIGEEYIIPTLGVWDRFEDIDFSSLPNQFVLKCTHDSGGLVICRDKATLDIEAARKKINASLRTNFFWVGREWPYKDVKPRIIAEEYMEDKASRELRDYKAFCFNGEPRFFYLSQGLENHKTARISFVTLDWQFAKYTRSDYAPFKKLPPRPKNLEKMIELARTLSKGTRFLRVDFYEINGSVYFGELTFHPNAGFNPFKKEEYDQELGSLMRL